MKHLLQYFPELSLHPKNAEELKGLILQLAVQGKLTAKWREENPDVEPASVLLARIKEEKVRLVKDKKIRKEKPQPEITEGEIPFDLPEGWVWCRVGDVATIKGGKRLPKGYQFSDTETEHVYIRVTDMKNGSVLNSRLKYITDEVFEIIKAYTISKDDLYITIAGTIGDVGEIPEELHNMNLTENAAKIMFYKTDKQFLKALLQSTTCRSQFLEKVNKMAQPKLALHRIASTLLPLPPLEEQKAIVKTVNQLFTEVEQLESLTKARIQLKEDFVTSALHQLHTGDTAKEWAFLQQHFPTFFTEESNIKKLRESILQLAVQGKLTRHWRKENPEVEDAAVLLERIKEEKAKLVKAKKIKKEKPLPEIAEEEMPYDLPEGWVWCRMQKIATIASNLVKPQGYLDFPHIAPNVIEKGNGRLLPFRSIKEDGVTSAKHLFFSGQIVYSKIRPNLNKLVEVDFDGLCSADMYPISPYILRSYLFNFMLSKSFLVQSVKSDTRVAMPKINQAELNKIIVPVPPLEEQKAIVEKVNTLMSLCDQLEKAIQTSKATQEDWMKSSLREVFEVEATY